ncbi:MAG: Asp-tRNA(Asn)/Glu-tRNA(Gln) amidotransferase subunit GatB [Candidatus Roizmanbacteria bacterium]
MEKYTLVIGLEIHVELKTKSKMFCQCSADYFGKQPNSQTCPVCLGMPGALPVPNQQAIEWTIKMGKALGCHINVITKFDRKHYFYPDLAKGYQISQYDEPIAVNGKLALKIKGNKEKGDEEKTFRIHRIHLEEDTGKLMHVNSDTLIDFNRSSVPLVEIVTEADFDNAEDVKCFLEELHTIIRYLGVSDADMDKGTMRMEPNISVKLKGHKGFPPYKVEVKNINSFNFVKRAIEYEFERQVALIENGEIPKQETRGFDDQKMITYSQRVKEEASDYRYFPEPDIPPLSFQEEILNIIENSIPELPAQKVARYIKDWKIKSDDAFIITRELEVAIYFEQVVFLASKDVKDLGEIPQKIANFMINKKITGDKLPSEFYEEVKTKLKPIESDPILLKDLVASVISANEKVVAEYKAGKLTVLMFLVGQVMKDAKGKLNANDVRVQFLKELS